MPRNIPYCLITDLEIVCFENKALAVGTVLRLNRLFEPERSLGLMSPPNNIGMSLAMKVLVDWMNNALNTANFTNDFDEYVYSGTSTSKQIFLFIFIFKEITYLGAYLRPKSASGAGRS